MEKRCAVDKCVDRSCGVLFGRPFLRRILCCVEYHAGFHVVAENREEIYEFLIARRGEYRIVIRVFVHRPVACADPEGRVYHVSASVHSDRVVVGDGSVVVKVACCRLCVGEHLVERPGSVLHIGIRVFKRDPLALVYVVENAVGLREHIEALGAVCEIINFVDAQHIVYVVNVPRLCEVVVLQIRGRHAVTVDGKNESLALDKHIQLVCVVAASGIGFKHT